MIGTRMFDNTRNWVTPIGLVLFRLSLNNLHLARNVIVYFTNKYICDTYSSLLGLITFRFEDDKLLGVFSAKPIVKDSVDVEDW